MAKSYNGLDRTEAFFAHYGRKDMKRGMNIFNPDYKPIGEKAQEQNRPTSSKSARKVSAEGKTKEKMQKLKEKAEKLKEHVQKTHKAPLNEIKTQNDYEQDAKEAAAQQSISSTHISKKETQSAIGRVIYVLQARQKYGDNQIESELLQVASNLFQRPDYLRDNADQINKELEALVNELPDDFTEKEHSSVYNLTKINYKKLIQNLPKDDSTESLAFKAGLLVALSDMIDRNKQKENVMKAEQARQQEYAQQQAMQTPRDKLIEAEKKRQAGRR